MKSKNNLITFILPSLLTALVILSSCIRHSDKLPYNKDVLCDLEEKTDNGKYFKTNIADYSSNSSKFISSETAFSGKKSIKLQEKARFGFNFKLEKVKVDDYYVISVWKKGPPETGILVVSAQNAKAFYRAEYKTVETVGEWSRSEIKLSIPPIVDGRDLNLYCWNPGDSIVYFDDMKITRHPARIYPDYKQSSLQIYIDSLQILKLEKIRERAFKNGILETTDDDWVEGMMFYEGEMLKTEFRLKGDWLDHLMGRKWSFRIKVKKGKVWKNMRTFSIQNPNTRDFLNEFVAHKIFDQEDVLTTRYGFIPVILNGKSLGIYAYEEHFDKQLIESNSRREGPIVKFTEEPFWVTQKVFKKDDKYFTLPVLEASRILPFKQSKTVRTEVLYNEFLIANKLMWQYKNQMISPEELFDIDKHAKYYALLDITKGYHGMAWHNQRFYFNPVSCKLEQIIFDNYTEDGVAQYADGPIWGNFSNQKLSDIENYNMLIKGLFRSQKFRDLYIDYLEEFSSQDYISTIFNKLRPQIDSFALILKKEFPEYQYDYDFLTTNTYKIRESLPRYKSRIKNEDTLNNFFEKPIKNLEFNLEYHKDIPDLYVNAYVEETTQDSIHLSIYNFYQQNIIPLGTGRNDRRLRNYFPPVYELDAFTSTYDTVDVEYLSTDTNARFLYFMVKDEDEIFTTPILPWPHPSGETPRQELIEKSSFPNSNIYTVEDQKVYFKNGNYTSDEFIVIPNGYDVIFEAGCELTLNNYAGFISFSPVSMNGSSNNPVVIKSDDGTANGFSVIKPNGNSKVNYTYFDNLNTLNYKGWLLTSAVTFYETNTHINNSFFINNNCEDALNIIRSDFNVENCQFENIFSDAFDSDFCTGTVDNVSFDNIGNDAIDFSTSQILIQNCEISNVGDKGVSGGEASTLTVKKTIIRGANIGFASKDNSTVEVIDCNIINCNYGIVALVKKPEYGPGKINVINLKYTDIKTLHLIELNSILQLNGEIINGTEEDVASIFY